MLTMSGLMSIPREAEEQVPHADQVAGVPIPREEDEQRRRRIIDALLLLHEARESRRRVMPITERDRAVREEQADSSSS